MFVYQTSKCGSFTNDEHFDKFFREMRFMCMNIKFAKEEYQERLDKRKKEMVKLITGENIWRQKNMLKNK